MEVMKSRHGLAVDTACDKKIVRIEEENKIALGQLYERCRGALEQLDERYREALEQRDRKNLQLEEENARLKERLRGLSGL